MRGASSVLAVAALIVSNAIPLFGVAVLGWSLMSIVVLYWLENGIVGLYNVFKIATARGDSAHRQASGGPAPRLPPRLTWPPAKAGPPRGCLVPFFVLHYGMFWIVHGVFVGLLPVFAGLATLGGQGEVVGVGMVDPTVVTVGAVSMLISHGLSFRLNWIGRRECERASPGAQTMSVYGRVVVLHMTIVGGAFLVGLLGTPIGALLVMVVVKTLIDLGLHLREHSAATARMAATT